MTIREQVDTIIEDAKLAAKRAQAADRENMQHLLELMTARSLVPTKPTQALSYDRDWAFGWKLYVLRTCRSTRAATARFHS